MAGCAEVPKSGAGEVVAVVVEVEPSPANGFRGGVVETAETEGAVLLGVVVVTALVLVTAAVAGEPNGALPYPLNPANGLVVEDADYRQERASKKVRVGTGQYFKCIKAFHT